MDSFSAEWKHYWKVGQSCTITVEAKERNKQEQGPFHSEVAFCDLEDESVI